MIEVRQILFPTDLSPASDLAFPHASALAQSLRARLLVYHAVEMPTAAYARWGADHDAEFRARVSEEARREMARRFTPPSAETELVVDSTVAAPALLVDAALLELIRQRQPDLVVMATHARSGLARAFIGSVTEQVLHHSRRPVLCVRPDGRASGVPYRRLLMPTDLSPASLRALPWAELLSRTFDAEVVALHVPPPPTVAALSGLAPAQPVPTADEVRRLLSPQLDRLSASAQVAAPGPAWAAIVGVAQERQADLIVMSSRGHDSLGDHILGSTADRVLRHSAIPVLVV